LADDSLPIRGIPPIGYGLLHLPGGLASGFVGVTLGPMLHRHGVSVTAISTMIGLGLLPTTLRFLMGPFVDMTLSSVRWYFLCTALLIAALLIVPFLPLDARSIPLLDILVFCAGVAAQGAACAAAGAMALTAPNAQRGAIAGWLNVGTLSGVAFGGGGSLWLATHAGGIATACIVLALICAACAAPALRFRIPPIHHGTGATAKALELGGALVAVLRTRQGVLVCLASVIPCSLGVSATLLPSVAGDWHVSTDMVALVTGALAGFTTAPGCILGGYLCDRFPRRIVYIWSAVAYAAGLTILALAPHTQGWFVGMVLINAFMLGVGYAGISAVIFDCLGLIGAATISAVLSSVCNVPVVVMVMIVGRVQTAHGSTAMLLTEAGAAVVSIAGYAALAWLWKPGGAVIPTVMAGAQSA